MRTVGAKLRLDVFDYLRGAKQSEQATKGIEDKLNDAAKAGDKTAKATAEIGRTGPRALKLTEHAAAQLNKQIDETRVSYEKLREQFERTGDLDVFEAMGKEFAKLQKQAQSRDSLLGGNDDDAKKKGVRLGGKMAEGVAAGLGKAGGPVADVLGKLFGTLPPQAQVGIGAGLVGAAALAAPGVAAAISGAALAGFGSGVVAAGVVSAFQDARVKKAGADLALDLKMLFGDVGQDFAGDTVAAMRRIKSEVNRLGLREALAPAAGYLQPLTEGLLGLAREAMPGIRAAIIGAERPIIALSAALPKLGRALGDLLEMFARNSEEGATALMMLFDVVIFGVKLVEMQIDALATAFGWFDSLPSWVTGWTGSWADSAKTGTSATDEWNNSLAGLRGKVDGTAAATVEAAPRITSMAAAMKAAGFAADWMKQAFDRLNGGFIDLRAAESAYQQAIDDLNASLKEHGATFKLNTEAGRANDAAMRQLRDSAVDLAQKQYDAKAATGDLVGAQKAANQVLAAAKQQFINSAIAAGGNATAVKALADQIFGVPKQWSTTITAYTVEASNKITGLKKEIKTLTGKVITITTRFVYQGQRIVGERMPGGTQIADRWGGVHIPMAAGGITQAGIYPASSPPLITFAEPQTGGEAYIPRLGDMDRSRAIWEYVGRNWLGTIGQGAAARSMPSGQGGGGWRPAELARAVARGFERVLSRASLRIDDQTARTAQIYVRGG